MSVLVLAGIIYKFAFNDDKAEKFEGLDVFMAGTEISALYDDGEKLWVGTSEGIFFINRDNGDLIKKIDADIQMIYSAMIIKSSDGLIFAGHDKGISVFDQEGKLLYQFSSPDIPSGRANCLFQDADIIWAGCQNGAVSFVKKDGKWSVEKVLNKENGLSENNIQVINKIGDELWFGTYLGNDRGGISILKDRDWSYITVDDGLPHRYINAIEKIDDANVLIGTGHLSAGGLCLARHINGKWSIDESWDQDDGIPGMKIRTLFTDSSGKLWITTEADGLIILNSVNDLENRPLKGFILTQDNGLVDNEVKCICESDECYWLGGKYGLTRYAK